MTDKVDAENIETFKKEQQEFESFVKEIEQKKKEFDSKREEIIKRSIIDKSEESSNYEITRELSFHKEQLPELINK